MSLLKLPAWLLNLSMRHLNLPVRLLKPSPELLNHEIEVEDSVVAALRASDPPEMLFPFRSLS